jgi:hypothetical protein
MSNVEVVLTGSTTRWLRLSKPPVCQFERSREPFYIVFRFEFSTPLELTKINLTLFYSPIYLLVALSH